MCLYVDKKATEKFKKKNKGKRIVVWKIINKRKEFRMGKQVYTTCFRQTILNNGWFKADKKPVIEKHVNHNNFGTTERDNVTHGIHVWKSRNIARECVFDSNERVIRCEALVKDLVAIGDCDDMVFSKIWIPKEQLK